jgi:hypothetical protein
MKSLATCLLCSLVFLLAHTGCERHSAAKTVPGYAEKMKEAAKDHTGGETTDPAAPGYFQTKEH